MLKAKKLKVLLLCCFLSFTLTCSGALSGMAMGLDTDRINNGYYAVGVTMGESSTENAATRITATLSAVMQTFR